MPLLDNERNHGTHQDRLVKKLRRHAIADAEAANRSRVLVCEAADGHIAIRYRDRLMRRTEITPGTVPAPVVPRTPTPPPRPRVKHTRPWRPSAEHPWRRDMAPVFAAMRAWQVADR